MNRTAIRFIGTLACAVSVLVSACQSTWDEEAKNLFLQACDEEAQSWNTNPTLRKSYCECTLNKTMNRYPKYTDALLHTLEDTILIMQWQACRAVHQP